MVTNFCLGIGSRGQCAIVVDVVVVRLIVFVGVGVGVDVVVAATERLISEFYF